MKKYVFILSLLVALLAGVCIAQESHLWLHNENIYIGQYAQYGITSLHDDKNHVICYISSSNTNSTTSISCVKLDK
jgi:hypothetical protein